MIFIGWFENTVQKACQGLVLLNNFCGYILGLIWLDMPGDRWAQESCSEQNAKSEGFFRALTSRMRRTIMSPRNLLERCMARVGKVLGIVVAVLIVAFFSMIQFASPCRRKDGYSGLRTINTAETSYASTYPKIGFSPSLVALGGTSTGAPSEQQAGLIPADMASGKFVEYRFTYSVTRDEKSGTNVGYAIHADPDPDVKPKPRAREPHNLWELIFRPKPQLEPRPYLYIDQSGVVRQETDHEANASSPVLQWSSYSSDCCSNSQ
jgi:hypothetical protein